VLRVGPGAAFASIDAALRAAQRGDTVLVLPGRYRERLVLRAGIEVRSAEPRRAVILPPAAPDSGAAVIAQGLASGRLVGFAIAAEPGDTLRLGLAVQDAAVEIEDVEISGVHGPGVEIAGARTATLRACSIHDNRGPGIRVRDGAAPRLAHNTVRANGRLAGDAAAPGVRIEAGCRPVLDGNVIAGNGAEGIWGLAADQVEAVRSRNWFAAGGRANGRGDVQVREVATP
jgi:parallel beta-helix repeat protein